jgi:acyl-CoA synthetase (AMP-forming)/AMP-acid ligase II
VRGYCGLTSDGGTLVIDYSIDRGCRRLVRSPASAGLFLWRPLALFGRRTLASYKKPRAYLRMDSLPRNAANKVLRQNLREAINAERATGKADRFQLVEG